jgi:hypothetical protein
MQEVSPMEAGQIDQFWPEVYTSGVHIQVEFYGRAVQSALSAA